MYDQGHYKEAREGLETPVRRNWQLASTHCHLARVGLVTDNLDFAKHHAALAWEHQADAEPYNTPRILWIDLAIATLEGDGLAQNDFFHVLQTLKPPRVGGPTSVGSTDPVAAPC